MSNETREQLYTQTKQIFASSGYDGLSMRTLGEKAGISTSVTYHYFKDKDVLLKEVFDTTNTRLGIERKKLPKAESTLQDLRQRIDFQFAHAEDVVFVLKYYLHYRESFKKIKGGYVPAKAYLHIEEVLKAGIQRGDIDPSLHIDEQAKVITHAINGFVLEYYPKPPRGKEREKLVNSIADFVYRAIERRVPA